MEQIRMAWHNMKNRCGKIRSYTDVSYCTEWEDYNEFREWYISNLYYVPTLELELDKDLLVKGNKIYSPSTCCLLPKEINVSIHIAHNINNALPTGVSYSHTSLRYMTKVSLCGTNSTYRSDSSVKCFEFYRQQKIKAVQDHVLKYIQYLPDNIINALDKYDVSIYDSCGSDEAIKRLRLLIQYECNKYGIPNIYE